MTSHGVTMDMKMKMNARKKGWTLVIDLDETLLHTRNNVVIFRPHLFFFLKEVFDVFKRVAIFTASVKAYADPLIDSIEQHVHVRFHKRFYRDSCISSVKGWIKDLRCVQRDVRHVLLLDNNPQSYALQPKCGIAIPSYWGQSNDIELIMIIRSLYERIHSSS